MAAVPESLRSRQGNALPTADAGVEEVKENPHATASVASGTADHIRSLAVIAILQSAPVLGAIEWYLIDVVEGLRGAGEEVVLFHPDVPELEPMARLAGGNVRTVAYDPALLSGPAPRLLLWLTRELRRLRPRVVHVNDVWSVAQVAARLAAGRVIVTHHTPALPRHDSLAGRAWLRLGWLAATDVVYTSESDSRADVGRLPSRLHSHVIYYGIDLERFSSAQPALERTGCRWVGNVARLALQKGQRHLVEAAPLVLARHPDVRFALVGDGELRAELEEQVRVAGLEQRFLFTGARTDVPELLASFDVFVLPSYFEGLCYAVIEAQAAGVPVVATAVGGVGENVVPGETGVLCEPGNSHSLAEGILFLLDRPDVAAALAIEARRRVFVRYARSRMVAETVALYG